MPSSAMIVGAGQQRGEARQGDGKAMVKRSYIAQWHCEANRDVAMRWHCKAKRSEAAARRSEDGPILAAAR